MHKSFLTKHGFYIIAIFIAILPYTAFSQATTFSTVATATFTVPYNLNVTIPLNFGLISTSMGNNQTLTISTTGSLRGTGTASSLGNVEAGSMSITGSNTQSITYQITNAVSNGGVSLSKFTCNYGGKGEVSCTSAKSGFPPTSRGTTLLFGAKGTFSTPFTDGSTAAPTFDIIILYV